MLRVQLFLFFIFYDWCFNQHVIIVIEHEIFHLNIYILNLKYVWINEVRPIPLFFFSIILVFFVLNIQIYFTITETHACSSPINESSSTTNVATKLWYLFRIHQVCIHNNAALLRIWYHTILPISFYIFFVCSYLKERLTICFCFVCLSQDLRR